MLLYPFDLVDAAQSVDGLRDGGLSLLVLAYAAAQKLLFLEALRLAAGAVGFGLLRILGDADEQKHIVVLDLYKALVDRSKVPRTVRR